MSLDRQTFDALGYVHVPGVIPPATCAAITADLLPHEHPLESWGERGILRGDKRVLKHSRYAAAACDGPLLTLVQALIGPEAQSDQRAMLITKPPSVGQAFPWHQDSAYYGNAATRYMIVTLYLDAATGENGPLAIIPGSHRDGLRPHDKQATGKRAIAHVDASAAVIVPAQVGDVVCMDVHLIHGSAPNISDQPRRTIRFGYLV